MLPQRKVLLIGWDGAGWNQIHPLLDSGAMPNLARLIENGVMGDLAPMTPFCSPLLWTSLSTGQTADKHGILHWEEDDPRTGGVRRVTRASLHAPHLWELLADQDIPVQSIGWPVTHPAPARYSCVSDQFAVGNEECVSPSLHELLSLRFSPAEWGGADLQLFVPELKKIDQDRDKRLAKLAVLLAHDASHHAAATKLLETEDVAFTAVWYGAAARAAATFLADDDPLYAGVIDGVYRYLDLFLGRLLQLAGRETRVLLVSDHAAEASASAGSRDAQGILCAAGPGIGTDELAHGARALDIAPTILGLFGFAKIDGMEGHAIEEICPGVAMERLAVREPLKSTEVETSPLQAEVGELEALGYKDAVGEVTAPERSKSRARRESNLALVLLSQGRVLDALPVLEQIAKAQPDSSEAKLHLAQAYLQTGRVADARVLAEELMDKHPESPLAPIAKAHLAIAEGDAAAAESHIAEGRKVFGPAGPLDVAVGTIYLRLEKWDKAAFAFESALRANPQLIDAHTGLAKAMLNGGHFEEAAEAALDALRLRYNLPEVHDTLGLALQALGRGEAAANAFAVRDRLRRVS